MRSPLDFEYRTRASRDRAEDALIHFALLTGAHALDYVVIGGLNPDFLAPQAPVPHLGTTDVDLLFEVGLSYNRDELDFEWLDEALIKGGFTKRAEAAGWRWEGVLGDAKVLLDFLCDVPDNPGQPIHLPGATRATAQNLAGPAHALNNAVERDLEVPDSLTTIFPDAPRTVRLRFANLGGYLLAKAAALESRNKDKDAYDLMFVLLYNDGGPAGAARAVHEIETPPYIDSPLPLLTHVIQRYGDATEDLASRFADQMLIAGDTATSEQLQSDAAVGARTFIHELAQLTSGDDNIGRNGW